MKKILVTGCGGFVGHHCVEYLLNHTDWEIYAVDSFEKEHRGVNLTNLGTWDRINFINDKYKSNRLKIIQQNLSKECNLPKVNYIINFASISCVAYSLTNPKFTINNNVNLMLNLLEYAKSCDLENFIQFSTDEVYGETTTQVKEWSSIVPSNPYSASKAAQEAIAIAYYRSYNLPITILNSMNIIGERQEPNKFLPFIIRNILTNQKTPIFTNDDIIGSRGYLCVEDVFKVILFILNLKQYTYSEGFDLPNRYNIPSKYYLDNLELLHIVSKLFSVNPNYYLLNSDTIRPGYDKSYMLDGEKLANLGCNYMDFSDLETRISQIVEWYKSNQSWL